MTPQTDHPLVYRSRVLDDAQRAALEDDIRTLAGQQPSGSVRALADKYNVGTSTIRRAAAAIDCADAWSAGAAKTNAATATRMAALSARRAELAADILDDIEDLRDELVDGTHEVAVGGPQGASIVTLRVGPQQRRDTASAINGLIRAHLQLVQHGEEREGTGAAASLLESFESELRRARQAREEAADPAPADEQG